MHKIKTLLKQIYKFIFEIIIIIYYSINLRIILHNIYIYILRGFIC